MTEPLRSADIDLGFVARRRASVAAVELDGEAVLYDEDSGAMHLLDPIATILWKCFDGSATLEELSHDLSEAFDADEDVIQADVLRLARQLGGQGLLEGVAPDEAAEAQRDAIPVAGPGESRDGAGA